MPPIETSRRYYHDSYARIFRSTAVEAVADERGTGVVLEETLFYPNSGGQPNDLGTLAGAGIVDVVIREQDGAVVHYLDRPVPLGPVDGTIDWGRRLDHMQQHTGQHVLSQAFIRTADAATIGFHLGTDYVSIDLDLPQLDESTRAEAFRVANEAVAADLAIKAWFPAPEELATIQLRKTPEVDGALRIVAIGDFDLSACGGTHVARTGEVGLVQCLRTDKLKRGTRISFLAGDRARRDYDEKHRIVATVSAALSCAVTEIPEAVDRLKDELQTTRRELEHHRAADLDREAGQLLESTPVGAPRLIARSWEGRSLDEIRGLALRLTSGPGVVALLAVSGERTQFVFARSEDVATNLKPGLDAALAVIGGGKGGGGRVVQGGGGAALPMVTAGALDAAAVAIGMSAE